MLTNLQPTQSGKAPCNGIEIYYETFGKVENPSVLLIMGLDAQLIMWSENLILPLVEAGYYVIRFDNRDIGHSTWLNDWHRAKPYTLEDMAQDTVELLDFLKIKKTHIMAVSMGGMIAQRIAISHSERVLTLTLTMTSGYVLNPSSVPMLKGKLLRYLLPFLLKKMYIKNKITNHDISVDNYLKTYRFLSGKRFPFNKSYFQEMFTYGIEIRKGQNPKARYQQFCAIAASGSRLKELHKIVVPTLIFHGTADPLIKPIHAKIYAPLIPNAKLVWLEGIGHELPKSILPEVLPELFELLKQVESSENP